MASMAGDARPLRFTVSPAGTALAFASTGNAAASPRSGTGRLDEPLAEVGDVEQERSAGQLQLHFAIVLRVGLTVQIHGYGQGSSCAAPARRTWWPRSTWPGSWAAAGRPLRRAASITRTSYPGQRGLQRTQSISSFLVPAARPAREVRGVLRPRRGSPGTQDSPTERIGPAPAGHIAP